LLRREIELYERYPDIAEKFERFVPDWAERAVKDAMREAKEKGWTEQHLRNRLVFIRREATMPDDVIGKYAKEIFGDNPGRNVNMPRKTSKEHLCEIAQVRLDNLMDDEKAAPGEYEELLNAIEAIYETRGFISASKALGPGPNEVFVKLSISSIQEDERRHEELLTLIQRILDTECGINDRTISDEEYLKSLTVSKIKEMISYHKTQLEQPGMRRLLGEVGIKNVEETVEGLEAELDKRDIYSGNENKSEH